MKRVLCLLSVLVFGGCMGRSVCEVEPQIQGAIAATTIVIDGIAEPLIEAHVTDPAKRKAYKTQLATARTAMATLSAALKVACPPEASTPAPPGPEPAREPEPNPGPN